MKIEMHEIPVKEIVEGYVDNDEDGVVGYGGMLNLRPPFQREFIYNDKDRKAVIDTVLKNFPLNVMYWVINRDGGYEILDGQQRTISICQYVSGEFSVNIDGYTKVFGNLTQSEQKKILDYNLMVYICDGDEKEKLDWFDTINMIGKQLTKQERRNAIYTGPWLTEAKIHFSKTGCPASEIGSKYMSGSAIRQENLETVLKWIADRDGTGIDDYMSKHQADTNCMDLWLYYQSVINWVNALFTTYRKEMKTVEWGTLYNKFKDNDYDPDELEEVIAALMMDDEIGKKAGIYDYIFDSEEKHLNIRAFSPSMARSAYERQKGVCPMCKGHFEIEEMEADHITPWSKGGKTNAENCQMLCVECNRRKGNI